MIHNVFISYQRNSRKSIYFYKICGNVLEYCAIKTCVWWFNIVLRQERQGPSVVAVGNVSESGVILLVNLFESQDSHWGRHIYAASTASISFHRFYCFHWVPTVSIASIEFSPLLSLGFLDLYNFHRVSIPRFHWVPLLPLSFHCSIGFPQGKKGHIHCEDKTYRRRRGANSNCRNDGHYLANWSIFSSNKSR